MKKQELVDSLAKESGLTKGDVEKSLTALVNVITKNISKGEEVSVVGLGKFERVHRRARNGINPTTKAKIKIPAKKAPRFKAAKAFKDAVK